VGEVDSGELVVPVDDLLGKPGKQSSFDGHCDVDLRFGETTVRGPMRVTGVADGLNDSVKATFRAQAVAKFACTRCTTEWFGEVDVEAEQYFGLTPDEDGYSIVDSAIDVGRPARDELSLALPVAPLCRHDCMGLCPTCGTDLNTNPCDGHGEESESPFSVLKDLFDS
jgi:DUF177 domain-containing protein